MKTGSILLLIAVLVQGTMAAQIEGERLFREKIKPLLESRCISCHGPDKVKGGLRMDSREALLKGGEAGPALVPGNPSQSLILQAVMHTKPDLEMPPKEKLTQNDVAFLRSWIKEGAPWVASGQVAKVHNPLGSTATLGNAWTDPANPIVRIFGGQRLDLWSLKPLTNSNPPKVKNKKWVRNPIDQFVLAKLEKAGVKPSSETDRRILLRRLTYDLTGLPPSPEEAEEFLNDSKQDSYERLVERLLASPRYGEHWARQWLDVVRYSDSNGFDWDEYRPKAWRFRDYVIRSLNADKPFDQFVKEQIAGDELLAGPPHDEKEQDKLIATGYLRLGPHDNSAPLFGEQARSRAELMADLVETTSSSFLGLSMGCARCHDHKFDPISQADHFRLRAFFEPVRFADDLPIDLGPAQDEIRKQNEEVDRIIKPIQARKEKILLAVKKNLRKEHVAKLTEAERALLEKPASEIREEEKSPQQELSKKVEPGEKEVQKALNSEEKGAVEALGKEIDELKKKRREFTLGLLMVDSTNEIPATKIHFQGNYKQEREAVEPGFLSILNPNPAIIRKPAKSASSGRRLALAEWIGSPENPLTARVIVNRIWLGHFGKGIVSTPNDFGLAGGYPTHPELLDWLASEFMKSGWSLKQLHRLIVTSATYRQSANADLTPTKTNRRKKATPVGAPDGSSHALYAHQTIRRLSAEQLRDSLLAVSGCLQKNQGGPPVWPELPADVLQANPALLDDNAEKTKGWYPTQGKEKNVRSIYLVQKRTVRVPFMETFDLPENTTSCPRRNESIVAPQALTLLNGTEAIDAARALAARIQSSTSDDPQAMIKGAYKLVLQREPDAEEVSMGLVFMKAYSLTEYCRALLNLNEFIYLD